ncbi:hypothetical protein FQR65_LT19748 [Abscondita terminalis]|nr:hypothetical protein FQR65_LT19748 [Abscondita terminalis]
MIIYGEIIMKIQHTKKKRLILLDLDGTTLMKNGSEIHPKTKEVLIKAKENGHDVCIITGRPHRASMKFYRELELTTLLTNFDGAHIHDPLKRQFKRIVLPISETTVSEIINNKVVKDNIDNVLIESYDKAISMKKDEFIENFFHLDDIEGDEYFDKEKKDDVIRALEKYKNTVKIQSGAVYGNLINKGFVSNILAQYYNKDIRDVIAFGDQMNDYEMLQNVGYGVAMKNGHDELKNIANGITTLTNDEGGVGEYLERLLAGEEV